MVERLIAYRRHLGGWLAEGKTRIYSHELAALGAVTPAVVRRDLMTIGYAGSPARGYDVPGLLNKIGALLDPPLEGGVVLVGGGRLAEAILMHFRQAHASLEISAVFDIAPEHGSGLAAGEACHPITEIEAVLSARPAIVGILAVPGALAQSVAERLVGAGVRGLLNCTPARLRLPPDVYVEDLDLAGSLEKVAFYAQRPESRVPAQAEHVALVSRDQTGLGE